MNFKLNWNDLWEGQVGGGGEGKTKKLFRRVSMDIFWNGTIIIKRSDDLKGRRRALFKVILFEKICY